MVSQSPGSGTTMRTGTRWNTCPKHRRGNYEFGERFDWRSASGTQRGMQQSTRARQTDARSFRPSRLCAYEGWTVTELKERARQLGISGYSDLNKERLIALIRSY
jgi:hypothetical protein